MKWKRQTISLGTKNNVIKIRPIEMLGELSMRTIPRLPGEPDESKSVALEASVTGLGTLRGKPRGRVGGVVNGTKAVTCCRAGEPRMRGRESCRVRNTRG